MTIDLSTLDAKIRKFQKLKELLSDAETRDLLADPEIRALIQQTVQGNGSLHNLEVGAEIKAHTPRQKLLRPGSLLQSVFGATTNLPNRFKVRDVLNAMTSSGYKFAAKKPEIAVNSALRKLAKWHFIRLVKKGSGRNPHIFGQAKD